MNMVNPLRCEAKPSGGFYVKFNVKIIGEIVKVEDGFYQFFPDTKNQGYWTSYMLKNVAELLDLMNKDWEDHISEYFKAGSQAYPKKE